MNNTENKPCVNVFIPCCMDLYNPDIAKNFISLLYILGFYPNYNPEQTCCGRDFYFSGDINTAKELGMKFTRLINTAYPTIFPTTACSGYIKSYFPKIYHNTSIHNDVKILLKNTFEISDFIVNQLKITTLGNRFNNRVYYFKTCQAKNVYQLGNEPEILLRNTKDIDLLEHEDENLCCGGNNNLYLQNNELSEKLLENLVGKAYQSGAQVITTTDIHCLQHIESYINTQNIQISTKHVIDIYISGLSKKNTKNLNTNAENSLNQC